MGGRGERERESRRAPEEQRCSQHESNEEEQGESQKGDNRGPGGAGGRTASKGPRRRPSPVALSHRSLSSTPPRLVRVGPLVFSSSSSSSSSRVGWLPMLLLLCCRGCFRCLRCETPVALDEERSAPGPTVAAHLFLQGALGDERTLPSESHRACCIIRGERRRGDTRRGCAAAAVSVKLTQRRRE